MKILAGKYKGVLIGKRPPAHLRPTSDKVREAMMNALGQNLADAHVLDLFSGTGSLGLEALSLGAAQVHFVETEPGLCRDIENALARMGLSEQGAVHRRDVFKEMKRLGGRPLSFDLVLADPPYDLGLGLKLLNEVDWPKILNPGGEGRD